MPRQFHQFTSGLVALNAAAKLAALGELPTRIVIMKWGANKTVKGPITVGLKALQASTLWDGLGYGEVCIDFDHNTVPGHESYRGEPAQIAALAIPQVIPGEGLVFENIRWTRKGIENREHYPNLSPAVKIDDDGEVIFCHSAALARNGAVRGIHLFSAVTSSANLNSRLSGLDSTLDGDLPRWP